MARSEWQDSEPEPAELDQGAEDWDEETLGLDWNEADAQILVEELISRKR